METFGNCQRPVFSLGVSHIMHKIANMWKLGLNRSSTLQENNSLKTPLLHKLLCSHMPEKSLTVLLRNYLFLNNYVNTERAVSHNVLHYQQLTIARYQVSFYARIYLPIIVPSAFKGSGHYW